MEIIDELLDTKAWGHWGSLHGNMEQICWKKRHASIKTLRLMLYFAYEALKYSKERMNSFKGSKDSHLIDLTSNVDQLEEEIRKVVMLQLCICIDVKMLITSNFDLSGW